MDNIGALLSNYDLPNSLKFLTFHCELLQLMRMPISWRGRERVVINGEV
ncbi:MAG: hypothetical protein RIM23_18425 [Coleofasciculus sp. G3-WIS-01]